MPTPTTPRVCTPDELDDLLPHALAGHQVLIPALRADQVTHLRPDLPVDEPGAALVVTTSGSTGRPKGVVLSSSALLASARATRERLGGPMDWYSPLPRQWVAGLMVLVRTHEAGTRAYQLATDLGDLPPASTPGARALSIVPTQLHRAMDDPDLVERLGGFAAVLLGGAPAEAWLLARARSAGIRVVTTYGMSETCGGCVYDGIPLDGVEVNVGSSGPEGCGRISISGPTLFCGYRLDPAATAQSLQAGRLLTQDRGRWHEGRLQVLGRVDDVVISGGVNIDLALVQRRVDALGIPGAVLGVADPEWGTRLVLVVEDDRCGDLDPTPWREQLADSGLDRAALPRQVRGVVGLPRTASGKIDRQGLAVLALA